MKIKGWGYSLPAKIIAFFLLVIMACITVGCVVAAMVLIDQDFYTRSSDEIKEEYLSHPAQSACGAVLHYLKIGDVQGALKYCERNDLFTVVLAQDGMPLWSNYDGVKTDWQFTFVYNIDAGEDSQIPAGDYTIQVYLDDTSQEQNEYSLIIMLVNLGFGLRYWIFAIGILALVLTAASFIFLMCAAGHRPGREEIVPGELTKIPFDLLTGFLLFAPLFMTVFISSSFSRYGDIATALLLAAGFIAAVSVGAAYCMNLAVRVKLGGFWKNTILYRLILLAIRICGAVWRGLAALAGNLPLLWKTALFALAITGLEFFILLICFRDPEVLLLFWFFEKAVMLPAVLYLALVLRRLQKGGEALARGDLSYQVDVGRMLWDFKRHGENLNSIGIGMARAVDDRLKSERFKTELITNVSHDIKTPLTSIINYSDLICKEETENEKIAEYAAVLLRQSERLKKLMEDLVEASKASTGNIEVLLAPCEVGVLLTQTVGEYEQRLKESGLELIARQPKAPVKIMADGRHLWRVFDNLMNNICKYAQSGTRVYLSVETEGGEAVISFKNTSKYPLDISTEELLERFVRGDSARFTDGNGLGLSIAQSLTELQKGKLKLFVDGDLFKVVLRFRYV